MDCIIQTVIAFRGLSLLIPGAEFHRTSAKLIQILSKTCVTASQVALSWHASREGAGRSFLL